MNEVLTDAVIAAVARRHRRAVLTLDRHFQHLEALLLPVEEAEAAS